jgi:hypothetical protein
LPTLRFGKAIEIFDYIRISSDTGFGAPRGVLRSGATEQNAKDPFLVPEGQGFFERPTDALASIHELLWLPPWEQGGRKSRESLGVDPGW